MTVWLLVAAATVGFAAAWLAFEARRAWSLEPARDRVADRDRAPGPPVAPANGSLPAEGVPELRAEIAELRRSLAWLQNQLVVASRPRPAPEPVAVATEPARAAEPHVATPPPTPPPASSTPAPPAERRVFDRDDAPFRRA